MEPAPSEENLWWVGVLLEATGAGLSATGKLLWRHAATSQKPFRWYMLGGLFSMIIYPFLDTTAYAFTSQQILSASSGYIIAFNVLGATVLLQEELTLNRAAAVVLIITGSLLVIVFGNHLENDYGLDDYLRLMSQPTAIVYYVIESLWLAVCAWIFCSSRGAQMLPVGSEVRAVLVASLGGSIAGNMWITKVGMELGSEGQLTILLGMLSITATIHMISLLLLAYGLRTGSALQLVTAYEASALLSSALSSVLVLSEYAGMAPSQLLLFYAVGVAPILVGLFFLAAWPTRWLGDGDRVILDCKGSGIDMDCVEALLEARCEQIGGCLRRAERALNDFLRRKPTATDDAQHGPREIQREMPTEASKLLPSAVAPPATSQAVRGSAASRAASAAHAMGEESLAASDDATGAPTPKG